MTTVAPPIVTIEIAPWFCKRHNLYAHTLTGQIFHSTSKAILFEGSATTEPQANCHHCGRKITHPISVKVGFGPICCENLGIPRPVIDDPEKLEELRLAIAEKTQWKGWIPRSVVKRTDPTVQRS